MPSAVFPMASSTHRWSERVVAYHVQPINALANAAAMAFLGFEYILTFSTELEHIWARRKTAVFVLFVTLRYTSLFGQIYVTLTETVEWITTTHEGCTSSYWAVQVISVVTDAVINGILAMRSYAIWNRKPTVLAGLCGFLIPLITLDVMRQLYAQRAGVVLFEGYHPLCQLIPKPVISRYNLAYLCLSMAFDTFLLFLNIVKTLGLVFDSRRLRMKKGIGYFLLRDGVLYFILVETLAAVVIVLSKVKTDGLLADFVMQLQPALTSVIAQRLVLNLRQVCEDDDKSISLHLRVSGMASDVAHGSIIGNIGAPMRTAVDELQCENMPEERGLSFEGQVDE